MAPLGSGGTPLTQMKGYSHLTHSYWLVVQRVTNYINPQWAALGSCCFGHLGEHTLMQYYVIQAAAIAVGDTPGRVSVPLPAFHCTA